MSSITLNSKKIKVVHIDGRLSYKIHLNGKIIELKPPQAPNTYEGIWINDSLKNEFLNMHDTVPRWKFANEKQLTGITMLNVQTIEERAFRYVPLTKIKIPKATTIGDDAFVATIDAKTTVVKMNKKFNTSAEKTRIFGYGEWYDITFIWVNDDGSVVTKNKYAGGFSNDDQKDAFLALTTAVEPRQFIREPKLTSIELPDVQSIGDYAFNTSPLTTIKIPKCQAIGQSAFQGTRNISLTEVTMPHKFNTSAWKDRIFGPLSWNNITFHWTNNDGTPYTAPKVTVLANFKDAAGSTDDNGLRITGLSTATWFNGNLWIKSKGTNGFGVHQGYNPSSNDPATTVFTQKELNDWLRNPASISGNWVTSDSRIPGGSYGGMLACHLGIFFKSDGHGGRIVTGFRLYPSDNTYTGWANGQVSYTFVLASTDAPALSTSPGIPAYSGGGMSGGMMGGGTGSFGTGGSYSSNGAVFYPGGTGGTGGMMGTGTGFGGVPSYYSGTGKKKK